MNGLKGGEHGFTGYLELSDRPERADGVSDISSSDSNNRPAGTDLLCDDW
ncbi:hypothetical protein [Rhodococcus sp. P1Y]|nr:hypothetical protein [Rhodococcus sp. P1Y]